MKIIRFKYCGNELITDLHKCTRFRYCSN